MILWLEIHGEKNLTIIVGWALSYYSTELNVRNWYELLPVLASTLAFLAWNVLYYIRNKRMPLLLVSYAVIAMFSPDYGCKRAHTEIGWISYNRENTWGAKRKKVGVA